MSDYLLPELLTQILLQLPIVSLIRCTAVCKEWRSFITGAAFVSAHLSLSRQNPLLLTAPTTGIHRPNTFSLHSDTDPPLRLSQTIHYPFPTLDGEDFRVVGSVDGLIFISDDLHGYTYRMFLWNPSIRKFITLPRPNFSFDKVGPYTFMLGFGRDSASGDYRIVRLVYLDGRDCWKVPPLVEVFSLRDRSWREVICTDMDYNLISNDWTQCFLHGAVHWICWKWGPERSYADFDMGILMFDVGKEEFTKMALPEAEAGEEVRPWDFTISLIGGMLSVFAIHKDRGSQAVRREPHLNIWVKRDYFADSWTKMLSLDFEKLEVGACLHLRKVCGDVLKEMGGGGDAGDCKAIHVPPEYGMPPRYDYFVFSYTESLALLDEGQAGSRGKVDEALE